MPKKMNMSKVAGRYGRRCLGKGIHVENDTRKTGLNNNDMIIGGSGTGKSGCIGHPQLMTLTDSSLVMVDTKGQFRKMFADKLSKRGYKVLNLDFVDPKVSCTYNPLDYVRQNEDGTYNEMDIMKISESLIPTDMDSHERFWPESAKHVLDFFIAYCLEALPEEDHYMDSVCRLYHLFIKDMGEVAFLPYIEAHPGSFVANRYAEIKRTQVTEKTLASIYAFVNLALYPFDVKALKGVFGTASSEAELPDPDEFDALLDEYCDGSDEYDLPDPLPEEECVDEEEKSWDAGFKDHLDITSLGNKKTVLFLNISDSDHSMDALINLFYTQTLQTLISEADAQENGQLPVPVRIIFDDFAAGAVIPDFDKILSVVRSRDIWLTMCIQSLSQLESLYGEAKALTILNNCDHIVYLGSNDIPSAQYIGTRAGKVPEQILAMDRSKEYFIEGGKMAVLRDKVPPYSYSGDDLQAS